MSASPTSCEDHAPCDAAPRRGYVLGVTGAIAGGKSALSRLLGLSGCRVIDVDRLGHEALDTPEMRAEVRARFGDGVLRDDGTVDRRALAQAFADPQALADLEALVHPVVRLSIQADLDRAQSDDATAVIDCALLFESGLDALCDATVFVNAPRDTRLERAARTRGWDADELDRREARQMPLAEKRGRATHVLTNDGDVAELAARAEALLAELESTEVERAAEAAPRRTER